MQTYQIQMTKQHLEDLQRIMEWGREDREEWMAHHDYDGDESERSEDERIVGSGYESIIAAIAESTDRDNNPCPRLHPANRLANHPVVLHWKP